MKNNSFYARPDTCKKALRANKQSRFPAKRGLIVDEWVEQRRDCGEKIENILRRTEVIKTAKSIVIKERVNLCDLNDYP